MRRARSPIALDFGEQRVKVVQLELRAGVVHMRAAADEPVAPGEAAHLPARQLDAASRALRRGRFAGRAARIGLALDHVGTRHVRLPSDQWDDAGERIAARIAAEPQAEAGLSICPLPVAELLEQGERKREYLCCTAAEPVIATAIARCEQLGLVPDAIELLPLAQCRPVLRGTAQDSFALLDLGHEKSRLAIVRAGTPVLLRSMPVGTHQLQQRLQDRLQLDAQALADLAADPADAELLQHAVADALAPLCKPLLVRLAEGIRYCGSLFHGRTVTHLRLCGGGAALPGLVPFLARRLGLSTDTVDPLPDAHGLPHGPTRAAWTAAVGLALGGLP
ncbi:MAG: pilus assembly protein PilM [Planctomycetota bacterium]